MAMAVVMTVSMFMFMAVTVTSVTVSMAETTIKQRMAVFMPYKQMSINLSAK